MTEHDLKKFFKDNCKLTIKYLDDGLIVDWLEDNYRSFLETVKFSDYTVSELFYLDFIIDYNRSNYSIYYTANKTELNHFVNSYAKSQIAKDFCENFDITKQVVVYHNYLDGKPKYDKFYDGIDKGFDKQFLWIKF